ncbi:MAG: DUF4373 domain-containing protein, partial [Tannerella sp.]|nr:DUF4373 domain-containing protein [Tannerella sp.]
MANSKTGLNYYSVDTDRYMDMKIKRLKKDFGCAGIAVYDYILCEIYRVRGCFLVWDESTAFDVAEYWGLKESLVNEIVNYCGVVGLFNKELLTRGSVSNSTQKMSLCGTMGNESSVSACVGIITSKSIQSRYIEMCNRAKRKDVVIPEFCKIPEESAKIPEESAKIPEESAKIPEESDKIPEVCGKVKESKVKESKVKESDSLAREVNSDSEIFSISQLKTLCGETWLETVGMKLHVAPENLKIFFDEFCVKQELSDYTNTINDFRRHF